MSTNLALTQLPAGTTITGAERVLAVQTGNDVTLTTAQFLTYVQSSLGALTSLTLGGAVLGGDVLAATGSASFSGAVVGASFKDSNGTGISPSASIMSFLVAGGEFMRLVVNGPLVLGVRLDFGATSGNSGDVNFNRVGAGVLQVGTTSANALGGFAPQSKAGAFAAGDFPSGSWYVGRDTSGATTKLYYNNAGVLMSVALA